MYLCQDPFPVYRPGQGRAFNPWINGIDGKSVACGKCESCVKNRKQAWTGKMVGEALTSKSVTFLTLTYKNDPEGVFNYAHVQGMLYRLRAHLARKHDGTKVRFFAVGENGEKNGRVHWHLLLFFDREFWFPVPKRGELSPFWDFGWSDVQNIRDPAEIVKKSFYCAKYAVKDLGGKGQRPRMSLKPALGTEWLLRHARETAKAALVPTGRYTLPGVVWSRGKRAGQKQQFAVRGSQIRHFIRAYNDAWAEVWPMHERPNSAWLQHYDPDGIDPVFSEKKSTARLRVARGGRVRPGRITVRPKREIDWSQEFWVNRLLCTPEWAAEIRVCYAGDHVNRAVVDTGDAVYPFEQSVGEVLEITAEEIHRIDTWVAAMRTRDWREHVATEEERLEKIERARRAAKERRSAEIAECLERTRQSERRKAGVAKTGPRIVVDGYISGAAVASLAYPKGAAAR